MSDVLESGPRNPWLLLAGLAGGAVALGIGGYVVRHDAAHEQTAAPSHHAPARQNQHEQPDAGWDGQSHEHRQAPVFLSYAHHKAMIRFTEHGAQALSAAGHGPRTRLHSRDVGIAFTDVRCSPQHKLLGRVVMIFNLYKSERTARNIELPMSSLTTDCLLDGKLSVVHSGRLTVVGDDIKYEYTTATGAAH